MAKENIAPRKAVLFDLLVRKEPLLDIELCARAERDWKSYPSPTPSHPFV
jgi:hypothetical protein